MIVPTATGGARCSVVIPLVLLTIAPFLGWLSPTVLAPVLKSAVSGNKLK